MRVCLLSSGHKPNDDRIFFKEARSLAKRYDDVWVVSPYAEKVPPESYGVNFRSIPTHSRNLFGRLKTMQDLYSVGTDIKADVYHCHEPESLVVAIKLKKRSGCKIIFDSHEMYSATLAQRFPAYIRRPVMSLYQLYERRKIKECDFAIGATWAISDYLATTVGRERTETILNGTLPDVFGEPNEQGWEEVTIICHDGSLDFARGLKTMIEAVAIVSRQYPVKFRIIGDVYGPEKKWLEDYMKANGLEGVVERTGWLDYHDVGKAILGCHVGLLALEKLPNHVIAAPNKIFNYMHLGLALVAPDHCVGIRKLIEEDQCGLTVVGHSPLAYAEAISWLIENRGEAAGMRRKAKKASDVKYNWNIMEKRLYAIYERLGRT